jgi:polyisoprenoid-binding protein YceI
MVKIKSVTISALLTVGVFGLAIATRAVAASDTWHIDPAHTSVEFSVRHMMVSNVKGRFNTVTGTINANGSDPNSIQIDADIDPSSIDTRVGFRDEDLKGPHFLDVEKYPKISFKSKKIEAAGTGKWKVSGDLTLHGVTKEVVLDVDGPSAVVKDKNGTGRIGASATTTINRKDFGMTYNRALDSGGVLVGDEVAISIDVEAVE